MFVPLQLKLSGDQKTVDRLIIIVVSLLVVVGALALFGSGGGDDSHITWWAVDELRRTGHFHNFNSVTLEQSSSLALVLIAALVRTFVPIPTPALGVALSLLATSASCWMTARVAGRIGPGLGLPAALLVATSGPLIYWGTSGMETALAAFAFVWLVDTLWYCLSQLERPASQRASWRSICVRVVPSVALFTSVRPENSLLLVGALAIGISCCALSSPARRQLLSAPSLHVGILSALAPMALLFGWRRWIFHEWFPHPVAAKAGGGARWLEGWRYLVHHTLDFQPALFVLLPVAIVAVFVAFFVRRVRALSLMLAAFSTLGLAFICASGGDWMSCGRFLAHQLPVWWLTILSALSLALENRRSRVLAVSVALSLVNLWFLVGLARSGGTNGYPLTAALKVVPKAREQYALQSYSFLELANKSHLRDALLSEELKRVVARVAPEIPGKIWIASGQAGAVPYHVFSSFPDRLRFIDFWSLTTSEVIPCLPASKLKHSALGVAATPELIFEYREVIRRDCHVPMADIVFNTSLRAGTRRGLEQRGYRVIYFQRGSMPSFAEPGMLRDGTSVDAYIAVKRELADKLHLLYREVRWTLTG